MAGHEGNQIAPLTYFPFEQCYGIHNSNCIQAALSFSCNEIDYFPWGQVDVFGEAVVKKFSLDAFQAFSTYSPSSMTSVARERMLYRFWLFVT